MPPLIGVGAQFREEGARNVVFLEGDATCLPFADQQFDLVVSRFALHHIDDTRRAAHEMARVCRPDGTVAIVDMVCEPGESGRTHNHLERLRDPSHRLALGEQELLDTLREAGVQASVSGERRQPIAALDWLDRAKPGVQERAQVLQTLRSELDGGPPSGLRAMLADGETLTIEQRWLIAGGLRT